MANSPILVGNDIAINSSSRIVRVKRPIEPRRAFAFPRVNAGKERQFPYRNLGTLAFNLASAQTIEQPPLVMPSIGDYHPRFWNREKIVLFSIVLVVIGLTIAAVANKQHIVTLADEAKSSASQMLQNTNNHKTVTPLSSPRQLIIHSSDYDSAMTDLMTQPITLAVGGSSQTVNGAEIANWINVKNQGSLTYLSVNTQQLTSYLNQVVATSNQAGNKVTYSQATVNQIANKLLKAQGITVTLPNA